MWMLDFFSQIFGQKQTAKQRPTVWAFGISGISAIYDISPSAYFNFYDANPAVSACINALCDDIWSYGFEIRPAEQQDENIEARKIFTSLVAVSSEHTPTSFIRRIVRDYELTGNAYIYTPRDGEKITALQILDPRYIQPIINEYGQLLGYIQNLNGVKFLTKDEIFHLKTDTDTSNEAVGRSRLRSLFGDVETDEQAKKSNLAFFTNNQTPTAIVVLNKNTEAFDDYESMSEYRQTLKNIFEGGKFRGAENRHRLAVADDIDKVIPIQTPVMPSELLGLRRFTIEIICSTLRVPKDILWLTDSSNRSISQEQALNYYSLIEAKENLISEFLSTIITDIFGDWWGFYIIKDNNRTLKARMDIASTGHNNGLITLNEAREILQYERVDNGDIFKNTNNQKNIL